jgi:hypothetical protein
MTDSTQFILLIILSALFISVFSGSAKILPLREEDRSIERPSKNRDENSEAMLG